MKNFKNLALFVLSALIVACPQAVWAKNSDQSAKLSLNQFSSRLQSEFDKELVGNLLDALKKEIDALSRVPGNTNSALQQFIDNYPWKGLIENKVTSGIVTVSDVKLNGFSKAIAVNPGDHIEGELKCSFNSDQVSSTGFYRILLGFRGQGAQTTVYNQVGAKANESQEKFNLTAPNNPGVYELRFRAVDDYSEADALQKWVDPQGQEPDAKTTVFLLIVKH